MDMKTVAIIGHFGLGKNLLNGQTIKTKIVSEELEKRLGENEIIKFDTNGGKVKFFILPFVIMNLLIKSYNVIIFPAHNGIRIIAPLLVLENFLLRRTLHYVVIGGWLPQFLEGKHFLTWILKKFDCIYVETTTMQKALEKKGFTNLFIMPNCKKLNIVTESEMVFLDKEPYKICTFSRVMKEKGIEDAISAICTVNEKFGKVVYELDIYGQVDTGQMEWFEKLKGTFPDYVKYQGTVSFEKSVDILKQYFLLLFPTRFYTEGIPGTIIDAYAAGIPVISARWESFADVVDEGITGIGYKFESVENLNEVLSFIAKQPDEINKMKKNCLRRAEDFNTSHVISILEKSLTIVKK